MKKRTQIAFTALLPALCLLLSACSGRDPDARTDEERQAVMDATPAAAQSSFEASGAEQESEPDAAAPRHVAVDPVTCELLG